MNDIQERLQKKVASLTEHIEAVDEKMKRLIQTRKNLSKKRRIVNGHLKQQLSKGAA